MRLWHQKLIHYLPNKQLLGQHRELSALRGLGWGRKHSTINYVFSHPYSLLFDYHWIVMKEMKDRGYKVDSSWKIRNYRGKTLEYQEPHSKFISGDDHKFKNVYKFETKPETMETDMIYPEHNDKYLKECLLNLKNKNAKLINGTSIEKELIKLDLKGIK